MPITDLPAAAPRVARLGPRIGPRIGMVARWKPVHRGHAAILETLAARADELVIGIGSANRYDLANPFTAEESAAMIRTVVGDHPHLTLVAIPDLGDGPRWRDLARQLLGPLDLFVSANDYVAQLLAPVYQLLHPLALLPPERRVAIDGAAVRRAMARGDGWQALVPPAIAAWIVERGVDQRFRREFGLATLALAASRPAIPPSPPPPTTAATT